jgi:hypothetical protein
MVGVHDTFGESGTGAALMDKYGLRATDIVAAVKRALERKKRTTTRQESLRIGNKQLRTLARASKKKR